MEFQHSNYKHIAMVINKSAPFSPLNSLAKDDDSIDFTADSSYDITPKSKRKLSLLRKSVSLKHLNVPERFTKSVNNLSLASQAPSSDTSNRTAGANSLDAAETHNKMKLQQKKDIARRKSNPKSLHVVKVKGGHVELHSSASCFQNSGNSMVHEEEDNDSSKQPPRKPKRHSSRGGGLRRTSSRREGRRESSVRRGSNNNNLSKAQLNAMNSSSKSRGKTRSKSKSRRNKDDKKMDGSNTSTVASSVRRMQDSSSNLTSSMRRTNTADNSGSNLLISPKRRAKSQDAKSTKAKIMLSMKDDDSASSMDSKSNSKRRARSHSRARKPGSDHSSSKKRVRSASRGGKNSGPNNKKSLEGGSSDHSTSNSNNGRGGSALRRARSIRELDKNVDVDCNRSASFSSGSARSFHHSFNEHIGASSGTNRRASRLALARAANQLAQNKQGGRSESQRALLRSDIKKTQGQGESSNKRGSMQNESKKAQVQSEAKKTQVQNESILKTQTQQSESQGVMDGSNKENTGKKSGIPPRPKNFRRAKSQSSLSVSSHATLRSDTSLGDLTPPTVTSTPVAQQPPSTRRPRGGRPSLKKSMSQSALMAGRSRKHHALDTLLELEPDKAGSSQDEDNSIVSTMTTYSAIERAVQDAVQEAISDALSQHTKHISTAAATNLIQRLQSGLVTG